MPNNAETVAKVTGSTSATYTVERRNADGSLTVESVETYTRPTVAARVTRASNGDYRVMRGDQLISNHGRRRAEAQSRADLLNESAPAYDMKAAWRFVVDCFDTGYGAHSPNRREWSDAAILDFVAEHHVNGLAEFEIPATKESAK